MIQVQVQIQSVNDLIVSFFDLVKDLLVRTSLCYCIITCIQHIGYLLILVIALAWCRRNYISSGLIRFNDVSHFFKLLCICK